MADPQLLQLDRLALFDTGVWTWVRDRRFPELATWFNAAVEAGLVLVCDLMILELTRLASNEGRAREIADRLAAFEAVPMPSELWSRARRTQLALAASGDHRRVPPADLLLAGAAEEAGVALVHYDRDYERIAAASALRRSGWCRTELWPDITGSSGEGFVDHVALVVARFVMRIDQRCATLRSQLRSSKRGRKRTKPANARALWTGVAGSATP